MKNLLVLAVIMMSANIWAAERTLIKDSKEVEAEISSQMVLCSARGYGQSELKINIKALDGWTILDHSNLRFGDRSGLPCMTAGACKNPWDNSGFEIDDIIQGNPRVEKIIVDRELIETRTLETIEHRKVCVRSLTENLHTVVAGITFLHSRSTNTSETLPERACSF